MLSTSGCSGERTTYVQPNNVSARVVNTVNRPSVDLELDFTTFGFADPVSLHQLGALGPVNGVETGEQLLRVICNFEEPLGQVLSGDGRVAPFATTFYNLFVGENKCCSWDTS